MMANGQHEDLIKFVSEAWTRIVENSRGEAPIFYKGNVPEQQPQQCRNSYSGSVAVNNNTKSSSNSSSSSSGSSNVPFRQQQQQPQ